MPYTNDMISYTDSLFSVKNNFLKLLVNYKTHIISWSVFICYEVLTVGLYTNNFGTLGSYILHYILNIGLFYFHAEVALPMALRNSGQSIWKVPVFVLLELALYVLLLFSLQKLLVTYTNISSRYPLIVNYKYFLSAFFRSLYFMAFSTGYYFLHSFIRERKKSELLEKQKLENEVSLARAENAFLKAQVNPHFLFNTLDFICQSAKEKSPIAAEGITALAQIMRYAVDTHHEDDYTSLSEELDQAENLITLHQIRNNHELQIRLSYEDEILEFTIIPLVVTTLLENIFKHAELHSPLSPAAITVELEDGHLVIKSDNLISSVKNSSGHGSGMQNIRRRLEFAYGEDAFFTYGNSDNVNYKVQIKIPAYKIKNKISSQIP